MLPNTYSFFDIGNRIIIGISVESAWHFLYTDLIFAYFFYSSTEFLYIMPVMLPKCLLFL